MNEFINQFQPLFETVKHFCYFQHFIHDELNSKYHVVGINATSPSLARKTTTMEKINDEIKLKNLPLEVIDSNVETTLFQIKLKK